MYNKEFIKQLEIDKIQIIKGSIQTLPFINHVGFLVHSDKGKFVIHNTPMDYNNQCGSIIIEPIKEWEKSRKTKEIKDTQISAINLKKYVVVNYKCKFNLLFYNCEHFVNKLFLKKSFSPQLIIVIFYILCISYSMLRNKK